MFLIVGACGSHYCNGKHPVGVFTDRAKAEDALQDIPLLVTNVNSPQIRAYHDAEIVELPLNVLRVLDVIGIELFAGCQ